MNEWWIQALEQVPALAVMAFLSIMVLRYLRDRDAFAKNERDGFMKYIETRDAAFAKLQEKTSNAIDKNTETLGRLRETIMSKVH